MLRYWASYGRCGFFGPFDSSESYARGDCVVVESPRGRETATILDPLDARMTCADPCGIILRRWREEDGTTEAGDWLERAAEAGAHLPMLIADAEMLLDQRTLILHIMPWGKADFDGWASEFSARWQINLRLLDLAAMPREKADGCGRPDCGEKSCGSGCGTCSRGSVNSAAELTGYFAALRERLESRRTPLT